MQTTGKSASRASSRSSVPSTQTKGFWALQDAKARFSELVRKVRSEGPQHVTVHGRDEVVVISAEEFQRLQGGRTGSDLLAALQACPYPDVELVDPGFPMPVRPVEL